jgi:hypothetical protein
MVMAATRLTDSARETFVTHPGRLPPSIGVNR